MLVPIVLEAEERALARAIDAGDRRTLLDAPGRPGVVARALARGDYGVTRACIERFSRSPSPVFGPWLEWLDDPDLNMWDVMYVAEDVLCPDEEGDLHPAPQGVLDAVYDLRRYQREGLWDAWEKGMHRARIALPWHPRLAIVEAVAQRERSRESAWRLLRGSFARFPDHFVIGQMFARELLYALNEEIVDAGEAREMWTPLAPLLAIDPDDCWLTTLEMCLFTDGFPEDRLPTIDDFSETGYFAAFGERRRRLLDEVAATPVD